MAETEQAAPAFSLRSFIQTLLSECRDEFDAEESVQERIRIVCSKPESLSVGPLVHREEAWPRKNDELSQRNREDGNAAYQDGKFDLAILLYTEAMRYAPCNPVLLEGEALALAAANRSAAYYQQKLYREAVEDVEVAVSAGYPHNTVYKLYIRKCKCELELGRINRAQVAFDAAVEAIEWSGLKKGVRSDLTVNLQEAFINLAKTANEEGVKVDLSGPSEDLTGKEKERSAVPERLRVAAAHPKFPSASEAIRVKYDASVGRHVVAARDIMPGEVLFMESPAVSCMMDDHVESICLQCLRYTTSPLPCPTCSDVSFCSVDCRTQALQTFHKYECRLTHVFQETGIKDLPLLLLAFRAVSQKPVEYFIKNAERLTGADPRFGLGDTEEYLSDDYRTLFNLCTHSHRRDTNDIYSKTIFAAFLLRCLQEVGYFRSVSDAAPGLTLSEPEVLVGSLLKHFLDCIQFNTHTIESIYENRVVAWDAETRFWKSCNRINIGDSIETVRIGGGVYPTMALVNHSCDPNFVIVFWGRVAVAVASRCIFEGEEINDNYGAHYSSMPVAERRKYLERSHWFTCSCSACSQNYPQYMRCAKDFKKLPGSAFKFKRCDRQKLNRDVEAIKKDIKLCVSKLEHERMYEMFLNWSELVDKLVIPPHQDFINIRKGIRSCIFKLSPNKARAREED